MNRLRRKPILAGLATAILVVGVVAWKFAVPSAAEAPRLEQYLPAETVGFIQVSNVRSQALRIIDSEAWRAFTRENQAASSLFMMAINHTGALDASYALALVGAELGANGKPQPGFVIVAEFDGRGARRTFENRVLRMVRGAREKGVEPTSELHNGAEILSFPESERNSFSYTQTGDALIISNLTGPIKKVLDVRTNRAKSLETNDKFVQARSRASSREGVFGFLDGVALATMIDNAPGADAPGEAAAFRQLFQGSGLKSLDTAVISSSFVDGRVVERVSVFAPHREGVLKTIAQNPPTSLSLLKFVPADASQVFDASIAGASEVFDELVTLANQASAVSSHPERKDLGDALREFTEKTGVDFRGEILASVGTEICVAQLPAGNHPGGILILNLRDENRFRSTLEKLAAQKKHSTTTREYSGVNVHAITNEKGNAIHYAFVEGNFLASAEAAAIERVLDTLRSGQSIPSSETFRAASEGSDSNRQFIYFNSNVDYLNRLGSMLTSKDYQFKESTQTVGLRPSFAFGVANADGFIIESRSPLGTFPRILAAMTAKLSTQEKASEKKEATEKTEKTGE